MFVFLSSTKWSNLLHNWTIIELFKAWSWSYLTNLRLLLPDMISYSCKQFSILFNSPKPVFDYDSIWVLYVLYEYPNSNFLLCDWKLVKNHCYKWPGHKKENANLQYLATTNWKFEKIQMKRNPSTPFKRYIRIFLFKRNFKCKKIKLDLLQPC